MTLQLHPSGEPETYQYVRVDYANMTEDEARQLYEHHSTPGRVVFSEWANVPLMYAKKGLPGAIFKTEGQAQAA